MILRSLLILALWLLFIAVCIAASFGVARFIRRRP
jgi:hypothetical protein